MHGLATSTSHNEQPGLCEDIYWMPVRADKTLQGKERAGKMEGMEWAGMGEGLIGSGKRVDLIGSRAH